MAHSRTQIDATLPFSIARVANVTGNPMLDVGYQCMDARPYWAFSGGGVTFYTRLSPKKCTEDTVVDVYELTTTTMDGYYYNSMAYYGTGTQNGTTLIINTSSYTNTGSGPITIRLFHVNKWAKYKPQAIDQMADITDAQRATTSYPYGLNVSVPTYFYELHNTTYAYIGLPQSGSARIQARLTDFAGYNHKAEPDIRGSLSYDPASTRVIATFTEGEPENTGAVSLAELVESFANHELTEYYPYLLASMLSDDGVAAYSDYILPFLNDSPDSLYASDQTFYRQLTSLSDYVANRSWKLTVFFSSRELSIGPDVTGVSIPASTDIFVVPGAQIVIDADGTIEELSPMEATTLNVGLMSTSGVPSSFNVTFEWTDGYDPDTTYWAEITSPDYTFSGLSSDVDSSGAYTNKTTVSVSARYVLVSLQAGTAYLTITCYGSKGGTTTNFGSFTVTTTF